MYIRGKTRIFAGEIKNYKSMQKTEEILMTIVVIVMLLMVILAVLLWQMRRRREKINRREELARRLTRENAEMTERLARRGINIPETIKLEQSV